jgi:hypothetical protein
MTCQPRLQFSQSVRCSFEISICGTNVNTSIQEAKEDGREVLRDGKGFRIVLRCCFQVSTLEAERAEIRKR